MPRNPTDPQRQYTPLTAAELDAAAEITPEDIARAQVSWRQHASPQFRTLLDATPAPETP
jgi:hypothetical protein